MRRFFLTFAIVFAAAIVLGRWYCYRQHLAERRIEAAQREAVERALAKVVSTDEFVSEGESLEELLRALARQCDVPLRVDRAALHDRNKIGTRSNYVPYGHVAFDEILDRIAQSASVGWCRNRDGILITSIPNADKANAPYTRVYRLPAGMSSGTKISDDAEELCNLISCLLEPDSWDEVGGPGVIRPAGGALVVHHRPEMHRRVETLLRHLASPPALRSFPLEYDPESDEQRIYQALDRIDSIDFRDEPLERVVEILSNRHKVPIVLQRTILAEAGITHDEPISKKLVNVSLRTILREVLADLRLTYMVRDHVVQISTPDDAESELVHWLYDVHDLTTPHSSRGLDGLIELIMTTVEPDSWDEVGGPGTIGLLGHRWLIVSQTQDIQDQVEFLLKRMREILAPTELDYVLLNPADKISPALDKSLDRRVRLSYHESPLADVCDQLTDLLGMPVLMRKSQLEEVSVTPDSPITIELPPLPLRHSLEMMLRDMNLASRVSGEVMEITTAEDAESSLKIRLLDVRHMTAPGAGGIDEQSLKHLIKSDIRPDSWDDVGGPGWLSYFRGLLVVQQTEDAHQEVRHLIDVLSELMLTPPSENSPHSVWLGRSTAEEEILARLHERESLQVVDPNVEEVVRTLCARHSIPVLFRQSYRDNADGEPLADFAHDFQDAPLHEILTTLLAEKGGGFAIWNGILFVTADSQLSARLFAVGPRWPGDKKLGGKEFASLLRSRVEPDSWDDAGGPGYTQAVNGEWLLVVQSLDVHRQIDDAIARLRAGQPLPEPAQ